MTTERDPGTRIVLSWLREETHENAERVLLRALDEVDTTPQRRSWWPAWRTSPMNTYAKLIAAAATLLVVAAVGYQFLPRSGGIGGQPFWIEAEAILGPVDHGARRADLRLPDRAARLDIDNDGMVEVDQVVDGVGEEGMPLERSGPLRGRV